VSSLKDLYAGSGSAYCISLGEVQQEMYVFRRLCMYTRGSAYIVLEHKTIL